MEEGDQRPDQFAYTLKKRMSLKYLILGTLEEKPYHGYELKQQIEYMFGHLWSLSFGQLYPTLHRMAEQNLIRYKVEPGKKSLDKNVYQITSKGKEVFRSWIDDSPKTFRMPVKDDFSILLFFLRKSKPAKLIEVLEYQKTALLKQLRVQEQNLVLHQHEHEFFIRSIMRKGIAHLTAEIEWIEEMIDETKKRGG